MEFHTTLRIALFTHLKPSVFGNPLCLLVLGKFSCQIAVGLYLFFYQKKPSYQLVMFLVGNYLPVHHFMCIDGSGLS